MSWIQKLKTGLKKTSQKINTGVTQIFTHKKLDHETLEQLEELLITSDMGVQNAHDITTSLKKQRFGQETSSDDVKAFLAQEIDSYLSPCAKTLDIPPTPKPFVLLMVGVNGSGKTTTIAKLSQQWQRAGLKVMLAACDTFRAAAIDQLKVWADRLQLPIVASHPGADAAGLAYDAYQKARKEGADLLVIDTAGRLQNNENLMRELEKICRVLKKIDPSLPHETILVLDATTGQNAINQIEVFHKNLSLTGLIMTKLDGSAKGGILVQIARTFDLPVYAVGVGEQPDDLQPFEARAFAENLVSLSSLKD